MSSDSGGMQALQPSLPAPENKLFYPAVDGLRAVAIVMVFFFHYNAGLGRLTLFGWAGVDVFFVLSGFLITGILYDSREDGHRFRNFYARRALRIFPLFYGVFAVLLLTTPLFGWNWQWSWLLWLTYLGELPAQLGLMSHGPTQDLISARYGWGLVVGHFWTLCLEEQFYLMWPLMVFAVKDRVKLRNLCLMLVVWTPILRTWLMLHDPAKYMGTSALYFGLPFRVDALLLGAAVALMLRGPEGPALKRSAGWMAGAGLTVWVLGWVIFGLVLKQGWGLYPEVPWISSLGFSAVDVIAAGVLLLAIQRGTRMFRWLSVQPLRKVGQISYGFYVLHELPHQVYFHASQRMIGRYTTHTAPLEALLAGSCTYALAWLSFRYFETPFLRLKRWFVVEKDLPVTV